MDTTHSYLADAREQLEHASWIQQHSDEIYAELSPLAHQPLPDETLVEQFLILFPYVTPHSGNVREWVKLANDIAQQLINTLQQTPPPTLTSAYLVQAPDPEATSSIEASLKRARKRLPVEVIGHTYLTLFGLHLYRGINTLSPRLVRSAVLTARQTNRPSIQSRAYLMLAFADLLAAEYPTALKQAELAFLYAENAQATRDSAFSAYIMSRVYRQLERPQSAAEWMQSALSRFQSAKHHSEFALAAHETGCNAFHDDDYSTARDRFQQALDASLKQDEPALTATYREALGATLMHLDEFDAAETQLQAALEHWESQQDTERSLHVCQMRAKLARRRHDEAAVQAHLDRCEVLLNRLYTNGEVATHMQQLRASLE